MFCDYGCEQEAKYQFKNGKWCCSKNISQCPAKRQLIKENLPNRTGKLNPFYNKTHSKQSRTKISQNRSGKLTGKDHPLYGKKHSDETKIKISQSKRGKTRTAPSWNKGKTYDELFGKEKAKHLKENHRNAIKGHASWNKLTISYLKSKYSFFSKIEEMRYNPDNLKEKEIQVRCKNHNCPNSKEQGGWFTPTYNQLYERIRQLEKVNGRDGCFFYCSSGCKYECPLFKVKSDPHENTQKPYTQEEYQTFREHVLERDNYKCQYCSGPAEHIHHERPQKLEPFFSLDPDLAWSVCKECHYKYGHRDDCSTGQLANKICMGGG